MHVPTCIIVLSHSECGKYELFYQFHVVFNMVLLLTNSGVDSPSERVASLSGRLGDLSVCSEESGLLTDGDNGGEGNPRHENASYRAHCCRSCE